MEENQVAGRGGGGVPVNGIPRRKPQNQPLTAIDRFLWGHKNHFPHQPNARSSKKHRQPRVNEGQETNSPPFYYQDQEGDEFLPLLAAGGFEEPSLVNGLLFLEQGVVGDSYENFKWAGENDFNKELAVGNYHKNRNSTGGAAKKRVKRACSSKKALIKGQWTDEEDM